MPGGALRRHRPLVEAALGDVMPRAAHLEFNAPLNIVVQPGKRVIPQRGAVGDVPRPGLILLTLDPDSAELATVANRAPARMIAHELHHARRWDGPGYGATLGEAMVSEGLAGAFANTLYGDPPEPWETALTPEIARYWGQREYDHGRWFFGTGDLPDGAGYTWAYGHIAAYLARYRDESATSLATVDAAHFVP